MSVYEERTSSGNRSIRTNTTNKSHTKEKQPGEEESDDTKDVSKTHICNFYKTKEGNANMV